MGTNKDKSRNSQTRPNERPMPVYDRLLPDTILKINIARRYLLLYPPGHNEAIKCVTNAYQLLNQLLQTKETLFLGTFKNNLVVNKKKLDASNPVYRELATSLINHGISAVIFKKGFGETDFSSLMEQLAGKPDTSQFKFKTDLIQVYHVDYGRVTVTEEKEITLTDDQEQKDLTSEQILSFTARLSSGQSYAYSAASSLFHDPVQLAGSLNNSEIFMEPVIESYNTLLNEQLAPSHETTTVQKSSQSDNLIRFLKELNPVLQQQFLSLTFTRCAENDDPERVELFLEQMGSPLLISMLHQANRENREISPGMLGMIQKVLDTVDQDDLNPMQQAMDKPLPESGTMKELFNREKYETYVEKEYDTVLKNLSEASKKGPGLLKEFDLDFYLKSLEEVKLATLQIRMILALIKKTRNNDEYKDFANEITKSLELLIDNGDFSILFQCIGIFRHHSRTGYTQEIKAHSKKGFNHFKKPHLIQKLLTAFENSPPRTRKKIKRFLLVLAPDIIQEIIFWCGQKKNLESNPDLVRLAAGFGEKALEEIKKNLNNSQPLFLRNMAILIKNTGGRNAVPLLKRLRYNDNVDVKMEALAGMITLKNNDAVSTLVDCFKNKNQELSLGAIELAGRLKIKETVPELMSMLHLIFYSNKIVMKNEAILKALAQIGDPSSLPVVEKILNRSWSFFPKRLRRLQKTAEKTLSGYSRMTDVEGT